MVMVLVKKVVIYKEYPSSLEECNTYSNMQRSAGMKGNDDY